VPPAHLALAQLGLGEIEAALASLQQARAECDPMITLVGVDPRFALLRRANM
jgi:hypothetical protein